MSAALLPPEVERAFRQKPGLRESLDEGALQALTRANPERAAQVIDELASKSDVRNPSAFVSSTIAKYPMLRPNLRQHNANLISGAAPPRSIYEVLQRHPGLEKALDAIALRRLEEVDIDRAADLLDDLAQRRGVRNPSAFIVHVLGRSTPAYDEQEGEVDRILQSYPHIRERLDSQALMKLSDADPGRVEEILQDMDSKGDVRNPSAFIVKALSSFPAPRHDANLPHRQLPEPEMQNVGGSQMTIYDVLDRHPGLQQALDASALQRLEEADFARAADVIEELALRPDVRNCSAFVVQALRHAVAPTYDDHDGEVDRILLRYPAIRGRLDSQALMKLADSDPARVEEILQDMDSKGDVRNPSAFIVKALSSFPAPRHDATIPNQQPPEPEMQKMGNSWMWQDESPLHQLLSSDPGLREALDDGAMRALEACDPERALEVVEDIIKKGDVRNPSAFVAASLAKYPQPRGTRSEELWTRPAQPPPPVAIPRPSVRSPPWPPARPQVHRSRSPVRHSVVDQVLARHRRLAEGLDADARRRLETVDPSRAVEIIEEVAKRADVRNPSAFVMRAISDHPQQRGDIHLDHPQQRGDVHDVLELLLARYPQVSAGLDEAAVSKLREAELDRAEEILEDMAHMGIHNPSAFVVKAVSSSRIRRGNPDALAPPPAKIARTQHRNGFYPEARTGGRMPEADLERRAAQAGLDDDALRLVRAADPARAAEVLEELELKGREVRNPSAFVSKSLSQFPMPRRR